MYDSFSSIFVIRVSLMPRESVAVMKNSFIVSATSTSLEMMVSSSMKTILLLDCNLSEKKGFTVFQNFLLSVISEMSRLL